MRDAALLEVDQATKRFPGPRQNWIGRRNWLTAVDGVSFTVAAGETLGLVGESGCGKSTVGLIALNLIKPTSGVMRFEGEDVDATDHARWRALRRHMQIVFQDSRGALDPRLTIGVQVREGLDIHRLGDAADRQARTEEALETVGLAGMGDRHPHQLSGGQQQRAAIARAIAVDPKLVVCDEPVAALDVSIAAQVVNLMRDMQAERGLAYLFISHDLSLVRHVADRIAVMYLGRIVELGARAEIFAAPAHPYTRALITAVPAARSWSVVGRIDDRLMPGEPPSAINPPAGCSLHPRCPRAEARCSEEAPALRDLGSGRQVACHFAERWA